MAGAPDRHQDDRRGCHRRCFLLSGARARRSDRVMLWNTAVRAKRSGGEGGKEHAAEADDLPPHKAHGQAGGDLGVTNSKDLVRVTFVYCNRGTYKKY